MQPMQKAARLISNVIRGSMTKKTKEKSKVQIAFDMYEHVFIRLNNAHMHESNRFEIGNPNRTESDFSEAEKAHLQLLKAKLDMEIGNRLNENMIRESVNNERMGTKIFWLNILIALLTMAITASAILELWQ